MHTRHTTPGAAARHSVRVSAAFQVELLKDFAPSDPDRVKMYYAGYAAFFSGVGVGLTNLASGSVCVPPRWSSGLAFQRVLCALAVLRSLLAVLWYAACV